MKREVKIGNRMVGDGHPGYIIAEAGINHNGDIEIAKQLIKAARHAGVDAVKFQKRTPELCVPPNSATRCVRPPGATSLIWNTARRRNLVRLNMMK